jgi:hypothetical protein
MLGFVARPEDRALRKPIAATEREADAGSYGRNVLRPCPARRNVRWHRSKEKREMTEKREGPTPVDVILYGHGDGESYTVVVVFGWDRPLPRNEIRLGVVTSKDRAVERAREFCEYFGLEYNVRVKEQSR